MAAGRVHDKNFFGDNLQLMFLQTLFPPADGTLIY
jgi:hypothetical protein